MKKILLVGLLLVMVIALTGCNLGEVITAEISGGGTAYITHSYDQLITTEVEDYSRISQGWIIIKGTDGTKYYTNEKNVLIVRKEKDYEHH